MIDFIRGQPVLVVLALATIATALSLFSLATRSSQAVVATPAIDTVQGQRVWLPIGPVTRLTFSDSLDSRKFADAVEATTVDTLRAALHQAKVVMDAAKVVSDLRKPASLVVSVSSNGQKLLDAGSVSFAIGKEGSILPQLKDGQGRIVELLKSGPGSAGKMAALSAAVVGAAHALSSADIARQLGSIETKIDQILAFRRIDQTAALERVFTSARELLVGPRTDVTELELWRLRGELRQMRSVWRRELELQLSKIDDPANASLLDRWFTFTSTTDEKIASRISEGELHLSLIEYALRLDQALAISGEQWDVSRATITSEIAEIDKVSKILETKAGYISKESTYATNARRIGKGMTELITAYRGLPLSNQLDASRPVALTNTK